MIGFILFLVVIGLVAGFLARLLVPGRDPMSVGQTILLGIVASSRCLSGGRSRVVRVVLCTAEVRPSGSHRELGQLGRSRC